ncbi:MAG: polymerase, sigma-24 subunit, subfamily protein [Chloroflexi bacterium]|jgi:RNA polymerase sigma-70 factor (ECF subfamily)|nr:polymerase, sigma-24 subunit, subfamily protein [Chloroflexota bacterium]
MSITAAVAGMSSGTAEATFEAVFADAYHRVVGLVAAVTGDQGLAEDAAQEGFARAYQRWSRVGRLDRPDLWVARVASRIAIDQWRRRRRETALDGADRVTIPDDVQRLWVRWQLERLSPMQRASILLHCWEGRPVAEVATLLGRSQATVRTHLLMGRRRFRGFVHEDESR